MVKVDADRLGLVALTVLGWVLFWFGVQSDATTTKLILLSAARVLP